MGRYIAGTGKIHVDDSLLSASDEDIADEFIERLEKTWTITHERVDIWYLEDAQRNIS